MVIRRRQHPAGRSAWLMIDMLVAMALLLAALLPIAYSITAERRFAKTVYQHAVAVEIVDGEAEVLAAGAWRTFTNGAHEYRVTALAATNLPPGRFTLAVEPGKFRLEWKPEATRHGGPVIREVLVK